MTRILCLALAAYIMGVATGALWFSPTCQPEIDEIASPGSTAADTPHPLRPGERR